MANRDWKLRVYDRNTVDYDAMQQWDQESIEISSPPIWIYKFNLEKSLKDKQSSIDGLYNESDMMNEEAIMEAYREGFELDFDAAIIRQGEEFDAAIETEGYYQEPTWQHELSRMGFPDVEEELAIIFNYKKMLADLGGEIKIGDVIKTFRNKIYRVTSAYPADEVIGWKYMHFNVMCVKPNETDFLNLPDDPDIPNTSGPGI
jgi:hypothetical protein